MSVEAKKVSGKYLFKLLALDVPSAAGPEQRLYLEGTPKIYLRGGVIGELRDPFLRVSSSRGQGSGFENEVDRVLGM